MWTVTKNTTEAPCCCCCCCCTWAMTKVFKLFFKNTKSLRNNSTFISIVFIK